MALQDLAEHTRHFPAENSVPEALEPHLPLPHQCWWGSVNPTSFFLSVNPTSFPPPLLEHNGKLISCFFSTCVQMCLPDQDWLLYIFTFRRQCFLPVCLKKSWPVEQWENPGSIKDVEAPPPTFLKTGILLCLLRQTLGNSCVPHSQVCGCLSGQILGMIP